MDWREADALISCINVLFGINHICALSALYCLQHREIEQVVTLPAVDFRQRGIILDNMPEEDCKLRDASNNELVHATDGYLAGLMSTCEGKPVEVLNHDLTVRETLVIKPKVRAASSACVSADTYALTNHPTRDTEDSLGSVVVTPINSEGAIVIETAGSCVDTVGNLTGTQSSVEVDPEAIGSAC